MKLVKRQDVEKIKLPGRVVQKCVGIDGFSKSTKLTMGFARYSKESGIMEPHRHAEEIVYILDSHKGWLRYGLEKGNMSENIPLHTGMVLHFKELEWHVFEFEDDGYIDIIFFYGQVDNIRPEESIKDIN